MNKPTKNQKIFLACLIVGGILLGMFAYEAAWILFPTFR